MQDKDPVDEAAPEIESNEGSSDVETPLPRRSSTLDDASAAPSKMGVPSKNNENFLLVRRTEGADWWQNKTYSSPTHTIDSGYDDSFRASNKRRLVLGAADDAASLEHEYANGSVNWQSNVMMRKRQADDSDESRTCSAAGNASTLWTGASDSASPVGNASVRRRHSDWSANKWRLASVLGYLNGTIADIQGQYAGLETFERSVAALYQRLLVIQLFDSLVTTRIKLGSVTCLTGREIVV